MTAEETKTMTNSIFALLDTLEEISPRLDEGSGRFGPRVSAMPTGEMDAWRYRSDPPLQVQTAALVNAILKEVQAFGLGRYQLDRFNLGEGGHQLLTVDIALPNWNWAIANRLDLKKELIATIQKYQNGHLAAGQQDNFRSLINTWAQRVRNDVKQRQTEEVAA
jgi:hypothetical protein